MSASAAQNLLVESSFGTTDPLSPNGKDIPHWTLTARGHSPHVLSDRIILTPPLPDHARGALWADHAIKAPEWTAEFEFRASGYDHMTSSGNLQLWYVQDKSAVDQNSVYTVGKFDGMVIVVDQYGGTGGSVRGFLNDGSQDFGGHTRLGSLAFGHCQYQYRNLGRLSKLRVSNGDALSVYIDDALCFSTDKIGLPAGYSFGITAATGETPDMFEAFSFRVTDTSSGAAHPGGSSQSNTERGEGEYHQEEDSSSLPGAPEVLPSQDADEIRDSNAQFADLHNRLQALAHQLADMNSQFDALHSKLDSRHTEVMHGMPTIPHDGLNTLARRVENIERSVTKIQRDVEGRDYKQHLSSLQDAVDHMRGGLTEGLPDTLGKST